MSFFVVAFFFLQRAPEKNSFYREPMCVVQQAGGSGRRHLCYRYSGKTKPGKFKYSSLTKKTPRIKVNKNSFSFSLERAERPCPWANSAPELIFKSLRYLPPSGFAVARATDVLKPAQLLFLYCVVFSVSLSHSLLNNLPFIKKT